MTISFQIWIAMKFILSIGDSTADNLRLTTAPWAKAQLTNLKMKLQPWLYPPAPPPNSLAWLPWFGIRWKSSLQDDGWIWLMNLSHWKNFGLGNVQAQGDFESSSTCSFAVQYQPQAAWIHFAHPFDVIPLFHLQRCTFFHCVGALLYARWGTMRWSCWNLRHPFVVYYMSINLPSHVISFLLSTFDPLKCHYGSRKTPYGLGILSVLSTV